ncbi:4,5-dihydroxyphthalate dehydrogenase [Salpingoeca rosetta]|uniref:4,5-dihydroxyphthalate dehydrogenase n=1 Tax=Salpingoeca rosetta (strain ATCC 50818 / BSB-021) TaxID=946362 RepID=F2U286_SALR5|nr:4,5-dihydroxyphthalate dehydrogenase [Salpingoeca rosetta]EGD81738.1 4,5-dihydroxyphthalate dehydrogenase [Salpingoeca rosetta]|eukprot:XP_004996942.1 4,5-dihydroxyphthalate dehydrogenase [Salpingoeca rosetta]
MGDKQAKQQRQITGVVVGCGQRGYGYSLYARDYPDRMKIVAAADPKTFRRDMMKQAHDLDDDHIFTDWRELAKRGKIADFVLVATQDRDHKEPAIAFANLGYHVLLEKPMAVTREDCQAISEACEKNSVMLCICHVLRYAPHNRLLKQLVESGRIGRLVNIQHTEPIGFFHFAHSYVRGNWRREDESTFALMAKSCHDIDLIRWWMGKKCLRVSSFGSLSEFHPARKPEGATARCLDCPLKDTCAYSATRIYLEHGFFAKVVADGPPTQENLEKSLRTSNYGKCVWQSDNDVVDNQVVNFEFEEGCTASFSMIAFTEKLCQRETTFYGTKRQLRCFSEREVVLYDFETQREERIQCDLPPPNTSLRGHGGADFFLVDAFTKAVAQNDPSFITTSARDALASHELVFDAEDARRKGAVVEPKAVA